MTRDEECVLAGPKYPTWSCNCGTHSNYASRIKCRCGREAPHRILQAARKAAERSKDVPAPSQGRRVAGAWAKGPPSDKENKELSRLRAENAELRQTAKRTENGETSPKEDAENEEEVWPNIAELASAVNFFFFFFFGTTEGYTWCCAKALHPQRDLGGGLKHSQWD